MSPELPWERECHSSTPKHIAKTTVTSQRSLPQKHDDPFHPLQFLSQDSCILLCRGKQQEGGGSNAPCRVVLLADAAMGVAAGCCACGHLAA